MEDQKHYNHITKAERSEISILLNKGYSQRDIGRALGRDHSSIGREIREGRRSTISRHGQPGDYEPAVADQKAYVRRKYASYQGKKIQDNEALRKYIIQGLKKHWNPDEIAGAMKRERQPYYASKTTIYEWLYSEWGQAYCEYLYSERYTPKRRKPKAKRHMIPYRVSITERPEAANKRTEYGHHEADTMVSGKKTGSTAALATDIDRKSRFLGVRKIPNLRPWTFNRAMSRIQKPLTPLKSRSYDNGIENRDYAKLGVPSYFYDPYSSWQKGSIENANKMLRRYFPKGMDLATVSPQKLAHVVSVINKKPRKILGYKSALQVMEENGLLRQTVATLNHKGGALRG